MKAYPLSISSLVAMFIISGCTTQSLPSGGALPPVEDRSGEAPPPVYPELERPPASAPSEPRSDASQATLALLRESERAKASGDNASAVAYVERAIRLEPRRADLWIELARLQLPQRAVAAERYARKALALAGDRADLQRDAWLVIADAKQAKGEPAEASAIRDRYRTYRG
ncbi:MAG: hypothetical protein ACR2PZ_17060 [Pseudomonadales bacterium]